MCEIVCPKTTLIIVFSMLLTACGGSSSKTPNKPVDQENPTTSPPKKDLLIPKGLYDIDQEVEHLTAKILPPEGNACEVTSEGKNYAGCTLSDVLNDLLNRDRFKPEVKVEFSTAKGFSAKGTLRQRGGATRMLPVKSFRIKLDKKGPAWHGEHRIQLLKTYGDPTRMRHKLNYDLVSEIENLPSMRTRYVLFSIKDKGEFSYEEAPIYNILSEYKETDLGVYLQVEYFGKEYLKRRSWPKNSRIYKIDKFRYKWEPEVFALNAKGKPRNKDRFERRVEIKSGKDHRAFVEMLKAVNNLQNDFNKDVLAKYFDRDNYINWLAVNILSSNWDTRYNNYYLYNPVETKRFYFVPWDFDNSYKEPTDWSVRPSKRVIPAPFWNTHALYWNILLHQRFIKGEDNVARLKKRIIELRQTVYSNANIKKKLAVYSSVVKKALLTAPDNLAGSGYEGATESKIKARFDLNVNQITEYADIIYSRIMKNYDSPMPFNIKSVEQKLGLFKAEWSPSVSLSGSEISYDVLISKTWHFTADDLVGEIKNIDKTSIQRSLNLSIGTYYVKVIARDTSNPDKLWQLSVDYVNGKFQGIKELVVE